MTKTKKRIFGAIVCLLMATAFICQVIADDPPDEEIPLNPYGVRSRNPYVVRKFWENGKEIDMIIVPGRPPEDYQAPAVTPPEPDIAGGTNTLSNVPALDWSYGCSATSAAMMFGYYDRTGYSNMYAGPTDGGVFPLPTSSIWGDTVYPGVTCMECPLSATHKDIDGRAIEGHVDDYWIDVDDAGPDPFIIGVWTEHTQGECTGDYMGTNQSLLDNTDGSTTFYLYGDGSPLYDYTGCEPGERDGCHGLKLFVESRGYTVATNGNFSQRIKGQGSNPDLGFTFDNFKTEIDAGRPVLIQVTMHTMLGYGYNDDTDETIYIHDTWDHLDHEMIWGGTYDGLQHYWVTVLQLTTSDGGTGGGAGGSKACFIATAAYTEHRAQSREQRDDFTLSSPLSAQSYKSLITLQKFRDERLLTNAPGRAFVSCYERISPPIAKFIEDKESLKAVVRFYLKPIVWGARKMTKPE